MTNLSKTTSPSAVVRKAEPWLSLGTWVYDQLQRNWPSFVTFLAWSGGMTWLSILSDPFHEYAPFSYGLVFGLSALLFTLVYVLIEWGAAKSADRRLKDALNSVPRNTNPLQGVFENEVIHLSDFELPDHMSFKDKTFRGCRIIGPQTILLSGHGEMVGCDGLAQFLRLSERQEVISPQAIMVFEDSSFRNCSFYRVTFIGPDELIDRLQAGGDRK